MIARVTRSTGSWYDIRDEDNQLRKARAGGKLRLLDRKMTNPIAVGDYVDVRGNSGESLRI